jgi:hypothetical protein
MLSCAPVGLPLRLEKDGCALLITPAVEIAVRKLLEAPVSATTVVPVTPDELTSCSLLSVALVYTLIVPADGVTGATTFVNKIAPAAVVRFGMLARTVVMAVVPEPVTSPERVMVWLAVR